jgi:quinol-cytochrome oxidoreductase complex cytochrome b subunit
MRSLKYPLLSFFNNMLVVYPTPANINYFWNFGVLAASILALQIITGVGLAMHYTPHIVFAFSSVDHIMRDLSYGWLLRYFHTTGASFFFIAVYAHMARGFYYGSYIFPRHHVWWSGLVIYLLMMATAFLGYVLPWGQMSFWGATVITNFFSVIPFYGNEIVVWLWGGPSIQNATLNRFFSLHYLLPFIIFALVFLHIILLHQPQSSNPLGISSVSDRIPFYPYFYVKDLLGLVIFMFCFAFLLFFFPEALNHSDNYIPANPLVTPPHIVPEWYFLPLYAILRAIPHKTAGVIAMLFAVVSLFFLPFFHTTPVRSGLFRPFYKFFFYIWMANVFLLGYLGACPAEPPYVFVSQCACFFYFFFLYVLIPVINALESFAFFHNKYDFKLFFYCDFYFFFYCSFSSYLFFGYIFVKLPAT